MLALIKYVLFGLLGLMLFAAVTSYAQTASDEALLPRPVPVTVPVRFAETGVLTFYAEHDGPQIWFLYEKPDSTLDARSLVVAGCSASCLESRFGSRQVRVTGILSDEHIAEASVALAPTTDDRIQFFTAKEGESGNASGVTLAPTEIGGTPSQVSAWADVTHDGTSETLFFKQGTLVPIGARTVSLLYASDGMLHFAVLVSR